MEMMLQQVEQERHQLENKIQVLEGCNKLSAANKMSYSHEDHQCASFDNLRQG